MIKKLIPLIAIVALLVIVLLVQMSREEPARMDEEWGLVELTPSGFLVSDVTSVEFYRGAKEDKKVILAKKDGKWRVESRYNVPAQKDKIDEFLKDIKSLEGELRSEGTAALDAFDLTDEKALHVAVFRNEEKQPSCHLLVGKKETYGRSFIRKREEDTVYTVNVNIASKLHLWGDDTDTEPDSDPWVDKTIVDLDKDKIVKIAMKTPDRSLVLEKREKKQEQEEDKGEDKKPGDKDEKKEFEWVLAEGGPAGVKFKKSGVDGILSALDKYEASGVEDPAKKKERGLDKPGFRCEVTLKDGKETILTVAREKPGNEAYLMVEGRDIIYNVAEWKFDDIFKDARDLFELKDYGEDEEKVRSMVLEYPDGTIELARDKGEKDWRIKTPETGLEFDKAEAKSVAKTFTGIIPVDYRDSDDLSAVGLDKPRMKASFVTDDGKKHTLALGAESKGVDEGRYALINGSKRIWVVKKYDVEHTLLEPKKFFEMEIAKIPADDIQKVSIDRKDTPLALEKRDEEWRVSSGKVPVEANKAKIEAFLKKFSPVKASGLVLGDDPAARKVTTTVTLHIKDKDPFEIRLAGEKNGKILARIKGKKAVLLFEKSDAEGFAPKLGDVAFLVLTEVMSKDIAKIAVQRKEDPFVLGQEDGKWQLSVDGKNVPCNQTKARTYTARFAKMTVTQFSTGPADLVPKDAETVVKITETDDSVVTLTLGKEKEGRTALRKNNAPLIYFLTKSRASSLAPPSKDLAQKQDEKSEKAEKKEPAESKNEQAEKPPEKQEIKK